MNVFIYCGTYFMYPLQVASTYGTENVRTLRNNIRHYEYENWQGTRRLLKQSQHPNEGETGLKPSLNDKWLFFCMMEDMANMRVDS